MAMFSLAGIPSFTTLESLAKQVSHLPAKQLAKDEDFWVAIRGGYKLKPDYINLENGYYCFLPEETLEKHIQHIRDVNYQGSYYMRTVKEENKKIMIGKLADLVDATPEEIGITRNTTESLDLVIGGFDWRPGDEAVMAEQDYFAMLQMFKQVNKRNGVVNKIVSVPLHPQSDEEIVKVYADAITSKTRLLMICHIINITGHILPVRKICDMAHSKGVQVLVDGAHAIGHFKFSMKDLDCDYYGSSLHKWLSVPLGVGLLYVKKEHISKTWPLLAPGEKEMDDIMRLNHLGTYPVHSDLAIANAIDYYNMVGAERKEERLRYIQNYWTSKVRKLPNIVLNTPEDPKRSCGIANVGVKGMKPKELADTLIKKYSIFTVAIDGAGVQGCRITPNIYTTTKELDVFVKALTELGS
ncbi:MAG: aminotransferase class V-fold PLP-dependent enzyme [Flammeovirgaceae bacterium]|nr:aminotransferase class V-fold PLP-dependent enzyme [Flammeovirgaceae bacterium]